jgi:hypothetical protein
MTSILKTNTIQDLSSTVLLETNGSGTITTNNIGGQNTPAFEAVLSNDQSVSNNTVTKIQFDTEVLDTDNCYDNSTNYRFTPTKAGKYFVYAQVDCYAGGASDLNVANLRLYKNGSQIHFAYSEFSNNNIQTITRNINTTVDMNGSSDYLECFCDINGASGGGEIFQGYQRRTNFGAYKIIGA